MRASSLGLRAQPGEFARGLRTQYVSKRHQQAGVVSHLASARGDTSTNRFSDSTFNSSAFALQFRDNFLVDPQLRTEFNPVARLANRGAVADFPGPPAFVGGAARNAVMCVESANGAAGLSRLGPCERFYRERRPGRGYSGQLRARGCAVRHTSDCYSYPT